MTLIGSAAYGQKVRLAGTLKRSMRGILTVIPTTAKDSQGTTWVKIKAPVRGFVLFATGGETDSLVSSSVVAIATQAWRQNTTYPLTK